MDYAIQGTTGTNLARQEVYTVELLKQVKVLDWLEPGPSQCSKVLITVSMNEDVVCSVVMDVSEGRIERVSVSSLAVVIDVVFNYFLEHSKTFRKVSVLCKVSSCTDLIERTPGTL